MSYAVMPLQDWQNIVDSVRAKTGKSEALVSAQVPNEINNITGGAELNIAYGDTAPEDTSKLWVKTSEPTGVIVSPNAEYVESGVTGVSTLSVTLPTPMQDHGCAVVGTKAYLIGGLVSTSKELSNKIYCFDTQSETFDEEKTVTLPTVLYRCSCAVVDKKIYIIGGMTTTSSITSALNKIYCFDTETNEIDECYTMPSKGYNYICMSRDKKIYIFGGMYGTTRYKSVQCYDTESASLTTVTNTDYAQGVGTGGMYGNDCYIHSENLLWHFNVNSLVFEKVNTPSDKYCTAIAVFNGYLYLFSWQYGYCYVADLSKPIAFELTDYDFSSTYMATKIGVTEECFYMFGGRGITDTDPKSAIARFSKSQLLPKVATDNLFLEVKNDGTNIPIINTDKVMIEAKIGEAYKGNADGFGNKVQKAIYQSGTWKNI